MGKARNLTNQKFGRLTTLKSTKKRRQGSVVWLCMCDCGNICYVGSGNLCSGNTKSCGCLWPDKMEKIHTKHGMCGTSLYRIWGEMIQRCYNPNNVSYKNYGGRGIQVCDEWRNSFALFADYAKKYLGPKPTPQHSIDRRDNDNDYMPGNIRWATRLEQNNNCRPVGSGPHKQCFFYGHGPGGKMVIWNNINEIARVLGLWISSISKCLNGKQKTTKGWTFQKI